MLLLMTVLTQNGRTALIIALQINRIEIAKYLIDIGADIIIRDDVST